jgi:predicted nucleic acid-binding protein
VVIPDSCAWIDYFDGRKNPQTGWMEENLTRLRIGLIDLVLCEVLQGIRDEATFAGISRDMALFEFLPSGSREVAIASVNNYRYLRKRGITIRTTIDCLIATFCIENGHTLLHNDRDFDAFEQHLGLSVLHPR